MGRPKTQAPAVDRVGGLVEIRKAFEVHIRLSLDGRRLGDGRSQCGDWPFDPSSVWAVVSNAAGFLSRRPRIGKEAA